MLAGVQLASITKREFFPLVDEGRFIVRFETPLGSSFEFTNRKARGDREDHNGKSLRFCRYGMAVG
ncbi:MAG: hypothetical protein Q9N34_00240 [Aquificota bacterium]|nr:hypothetical protein [Aquificota bacterium]